jgi:hypothetical protein
MKLLFQALIIFSVPPAIIYVLSQMGVTSDGLFYAFLSVFAACYLYYKISK